MGNQNSSGQSSKQKRYYSVEYLNDMTNNNKSGHQNNGPVDDTQVTANNNSSTLSIHQQTPSSKGKPSPYSSPSKKSSRIASKPVQVAGKKLNVKNLSNPNLFLLPRIENPLTSKKQAPLAPAPLNKPSRPLSLLAKASHSAESSSSATTTITESVATNKTATSNYESMDYFSESTSTPVINSKSAKTTSKPSFDMVSVKQSLDKILDFDNINKEVDNEIIKSSPSKSIHSPAPSSVGLNTSSVATIEDVEVQITDKAVDKDLTELDLTQMLAIIRNNGAFVKRSKTTYVRPENKVLPRQFLNKPLKVTNLLKTEGLKKTWRNKNIKKSNSFLVVGDRVAGICNDLEENVKPSLLKNIFSDSKRSSLRSSHNVIFESSSKTCGNVNELKSENKALGLSSDSAYSSDTMGDRTGSSFMDFLKNDASRTEIMKKYSCSYFDLSNKSSQLKTSSESNQQRSESTFKMISSHSLLDLKNVVEIVPKEESEKKANKTSKSLLSQMKTFSTSSNGSGKNDSSTSKNKHLSVGDLNTLGVIEYEPNGNDGRENSKLNKPSVSGRKKTDSSKSPNKFVNRLISIASAPKEVANNSVHASTKQENGPRSNSSSNSKQLSNQDIEIISRFPIDSKVYRHYISGGKSNKSDQLANSVNINKMIDDQIRLRDKSKSKPAIQEAEYDSITDCQSSVPNSRCNSKSKNLKISNNFQIILMFSY
jgi:hypothetical protein